MKRYVAILLALPLLAVDPGPRTARGLEEPGAKAAAVLLKVGGEVPHPLTFTAQEFAGLPRQSVRAKDRDGKEVEFEGVPVFEILQRAGLKLGQDLRGPALASYLLVEAADG